MTSAAEERESAVLSLLRDRYEGEGYEVFLHPTPSVLPEVLRDYRPDMIAIRGNDRIVVEVKTKGGKWDDQRARDLAAKFDGIPDWKLVVVTAPVGAETSDFEPPSLEDVHTQIAEAESLLESGHPRPALVIAWATLESIVHRYAPIGNLRGGRSHSAMQVVQQLEMRGFVDSLVARQLRKAIPARNAVVHGEARFPVEPELVAWVLSVANRLASLASDPGQQA